MPWRRCWPTAHEWSPSDKRQQRLPGQCTADSCPPQCCEPPWDWMRVTDPAPRILIMSGNDGVSDVRVLKNVATAASFGLDTHALGIRRTGADQTVEVGDATLRIVRVTPRLALVGI